MISSIAKFLPVYIQKRSQHLFRFSYELLYVSIQTRLYLHPLREELTVSSTISLYSTLLASVSLRAFDSR
ncbi:hypothetical protein VPHF99_0015 [Vibrio phage F99]